MFGIASNSKKSTRIMLSVVLAVVGASANVALAAVDADAAQALAKKSECLKCHSVDKDKKGPAYKKIAAKYKGKADAEDKVVKAITTGPKVKFADGSEEEHKVVETKDAGAIKNLANWILAQ